MLVAARRFDIDAVMDGVVAPIIYRDLFGDQPSIERVRDLVTDVLAREPIRQPHRFCADICDVGAQRGGGAPACADADPCAAWRPRAPPASGRRVTTRPGT